MKKVSKVWVIDFGSQYTQLIARRVRECNVYSEIVEPDVVPERIEEEGVGAIILSGGPASVYEDASPEPDPRIFGMGLPILGICYGLQLVAKHFGAKVHSDRIREYGRSLVKVSKPSAIFGGLRDSFYVWMSHGDHIDTIPDSFDVVAYSENGAPAALVHKEKPIVGLQFHPEVVHTPDGIEIIKNFLFKIAGLRADFTSAYIVDEIKEEVVREVGDEKVLVAVSGGVDSSVMAVILYQALGRRCVPVFINNGLLRMNEQEEVIGRLKKELGVPIKGFNYSKVFLSALRGVVDPEKKRKIIGRTFIRAFEEISKKYRDVKYLAQGTLYPDVIESRSVKGPSRTIKSHHNVGGLPKRLKFRLIEPFKFLFKDEVRRIGKELGIPDEILLRHPFPGPGLAVRIIGEVTPYRLQLLRKADKIFLDELKESGEYYKIWQAFAVLLPVKTVGVMGDKRTYENVVALRAVTSKDGMTADWAKIPYDVFDRVATKIVNKVKGVNRVVYDITSKPPGTIEWE
ncbi:MAG: GMP synthase (glutamine-hydrolyzing) [Candidatus Neomarinimicrobiota bacterium]|nr:MAG: GMP synthase (glutamine-hydrolyzing) [Candidatus Neomarinimicrobiota bacterium]